NLLSETEEQDRCRDIDPGLHVWVLGARTKTAHVEPLDTEQARAKEAAHQEGDRAHERNDEGAAAGPSQRAPAETADTRAAMLDGNHEKCGSQRPDTAEE